jgi:rhamnogalacturonyl hydrolase YesR
VKKLALAFFFVLTFPLAAQRRRAVSIPALPAVTRASVTATALRVIDRTQIPAFEPRLHWENVPYFDGTLLVAEQLQRNDLIERVAPVLLNSNDNIDSIYWGDGTAFSQALLDLYRLLPPTDPRRAAIPSLLNGSMSFAEHAIRATPQTAPPRNPWWVAGGYGVRYWQDDMYMVIPWLAMYGSIEPKARDLAHEWTEAYVRVLWDPQHDLFQHAPETIGSDEFWGRGNGWSVYGLARAAYENRELLQRAAARLAQKQLPSGGWPSNLSRPLECPVVETSATGLITAFLARGVNEGWLDRETYTPIVLRAFAVLMDRVDAEGVVHGIQPPGTGAAFCSAGTLSTNQTTINVNYGAGVVLLAAAEMLQLLPSS